MARTGRRSAAEIAEEIGPDAAGVAVPDVADVAYVPNGANTPKEVEEEKLPELKPEASIHERMIRIIAELPAIGKDQWNEQQRFHFRGYDQVLNALNPLLGRHGVHFVPRVIERVAAERTTSANKTMYEVNLHVEFTFYGSRGDEIVASGWGEGTDMGDKATNKAMTGALKYVLFQAFAISTAEASDSDAESPEETTRNGGKAETAVDQPPPPSWGSMKAEVVKMYDEDTWEALAAFFAQAAERVYGTRDLSDAQKFQLRGAADHVIQALVEIIPPGGAIFPDRAHMQRAFGRVFGTALGGEALAGPVWRMGPEEGDRSVREPAAPEEGGDTPTGDDSGDGPRSGTADPWDDESNDLDASEAKAFEETASQEIPED